MATTINTEFLKPLACNWRGKVKTDSNYSTQFNRINIVKYPYGGTCKWIELRKNEADENGNYPDNEPIVPVEMSSVCYTVYVDSQTGSGLEGGPIETGDGTIENPFINLNSVFSDSCLRGYFSRLFCCIPVLIKVKGSIDYRVSGDRDFNFRKGLIIEPWESETIVFQLAVPTSYYGVINYLRGVVFKNCFICMPRAYSQRGYYDFNNCILNNCNVLLDMTNSENTVMAFSDMVSCQIYDTDISIDYLSGATAVYSSPGSYFYDLNIHSTSMSENRYSYLYGMTFVTNSIINHFSFVFDSEAGNKVGALVKFVGFINTGYNTIYNGTITANRGLYEIFGFLNVSNSDLRNVMIDAEIYIQYERINYTYFSTVSCGFSQSPYNSYIDCSVNLKASIKAISDESILGARFSGFFDSPFATFKNCSSTLNVNISGTMRDAYWYAVDFLVNHDSVWVDCSGSGTICNPGGNANFCNNIASDLK